LHGLPASFKPSSDALFPLTNGLKVFYETAMTVLTEAENESMLLAWSAGGATESRRSLKIKPDRSLLDSVRDDRFKQLWIRVWVQLDDSKAVQLRLRGK